MNPLNNQDIFVKENNDLSGDQVTVFTQIVPDPNIKLLQSLFEG